MRDLGTKQGLRIGVSTAFLVLAFIAIIGGLFYHQVILHSKYTIESENNRIRIQPIIPKRGVIFDRNLEVIADNRLSFTVSIVPFETKKDVTISQLMELLNMDSTAITKRAKANFISNHIPSPIKRGLDIDVISILEEQGEKYPGITYSIESVRRYQPDIAAETFIGYVGEVSPEEIKAFPDKEYRPGSLIGKKGIEKTYDHLMRGIEGTEYIEISAKGKIIGSYEGKDKIPAVPGDDISLTIDIDLQNFIVESFNSFDTQYCCGSVVAMDPRNGEILGLASFPQLDPNTFSGPIPSDVWQSIISDSMHPLLNRPLAGIYTPGSTTKPITAGAALELNKITDKLLFRPCLGGMKFGNRVFHCWNLGGHGRLDLNHSIEQSCNVYFYQVGLLVGIDPWSEFAVRSGFGKKTGIDVPGEVPGIVPNSAYLDNLYGVKKWTHFLMLNLSIGQGEFTITPLQLAQFYCGLANHGRVYRPHFLRERLRYDGSTVKIAPALSFNLPFSEKTLGILNESLKLVVQGEHGTARGRRKADYNISGKTGTAENPHGENHSWFVAFAPSEKPRIVVAALVENGGHGSDVAAPLVGKVIDYYLRNNVPEIFEKKEEDMKETNKTEVEG
ncbi:MAG: penicillin-binding protein 2 [candidate division Zixibacteria bacterium]|nr:penicillin-binding protein 2 [candidate division Zixibacteria bacterium]